MRNTTIIILTFNHLEYTQECIKSIRKYTKKNTYEILVIDNCSTDGTKDWLQRQVDVKAIYNDENLGFPKGCNQGISLANPNNDILLLNNDTIVTENWLDNLKICLYSNHLIGAVGSVCNQHENRQGVSFTYEDFDTMQILAKENNVSDATKWEEKVFLIGFCVLIKREVINQLHFLDEFYTPGYIEDNDLSLRIIQLGYKLMLCHDSFIHHYLGVGFRQDLDAFYKILDKNRKYFYSKWHFTSFAFDEMKSCSFPLLKEPKKILELNCGLGVTLLSLKYTYKNVTVHGIEPQISKRRIAKHLADVYEKIEDVQDHDYDYILIGDLLEKIKNPRAFLKKIKKYGNQHTYLVGEIHNPINIRKMNKLIHGSFSSQYSTQKNWFTLPEMKELLEQTGYTDFCYYAWYENYSLEEQQLFETLHCSILYYTYFAFRVKWK